MKMTLKKEKNSSEDSEGEELDEFAPKKSRK
jgi:hypothetical protein